MCIFSGVAFSQSVSRDSSIPTKVKQTGAFDSGPFFVTYEDMLIIDLDQLNDETGEELYKFRKWLHVKDRQWKEVSTNELSTLNLKEGLVFQAIDFRSGIKKTFKLGKKVWLAMIGNDFHEESSPTSSFYRTFYISLRPSKEGIKHPGEPNGDEITGIAYSGKVYELKPSKECNVMKLNASSALRPATDDESKLYLSLLEEAVPKETIFTEDFSFDSVVLKSMVYSVKDQRVDAELFLRNNDGMFKRLELPVNGYKTYRDYRFSQFISGADLTVLKMKQRTYELFILQKGIKTVIPLQFYAGGD